MREAIDYNALSWIRQEVGLTLKQARLDLEEYAEGEQRKELLQGCTAHLHEARGPLQMVNIKGADMLACEMEEAIADLLLETVVDRDTLLEQLMQGFLELPEYLSNLRSGKGDNPKLLFPLINSLRASRGLQPLSEDAIFSPDLSVRIPVSVFDANAGHHGKDMATLARTARVRFQGGLLEWYRDSTSNNGLQVLVEVLEHLREMACSEPVARLWWVGAGVAELLRDGEIEAGPAIKRLFGQLDRQIKRLMDSGESVFSDILTEDLLKNLLFQLAGTTTDSPRIRTIRSTFGISANKSSTQDTSNLASDIGDELLQTVSATANEDVERIKDQLDSLTRNPRGDSRALTEVADSMHSLGNTLGMIGLEKLGGRLLEKVQQLHAHVAADGSNGDVDYTDLANTVVAVEDALSDITLHSGSGDTAEDHGESVLRQGQLAVINAVITDISAAKDAFNGFLKSSGEFELLEAVPMLMNKIHGGLELVGEDRLAVAARQIRRFISNELLERRRQLNESELDSLADAICSIEYCVEELGENHRFGERAIGVAIASLGKLGYSDAGLTADTPPSAAEPGPSVSGIPDAAGTVAGTAEPDYQSEPEQDSPLQTVTPEEDGGLEPGQINASVCTPIEELQVVAPDADGEIVEIFIEEAGEVLEKLAVDVTSWIANPDDRDRMTEIRRAFHTIKGSGRMIGAMMAGELAWAFENLMNRVIEGKVPASAAVLELIGQATPALNALVAQVGNPETGLFVDVGALGKRAAELSQSGADGARPEIAGEMREVSGEDVQADDANIRVDAAHAEPAEPLEIPQASSVPEQSELDETICQDSEDLPAGRDDAELPVLKPEADPEIVEIFLEEAHEELASLSVKIPEWIQQPEDTELLGEIRRSLHTLKGSGRMAGAMQTGEFAWCMEVLLNRLIEGTVQPGGSLFALLAHVPQAVSGLLRQLQDGSVPDTDVDDMIRKAAGLAKTGPVESVGESTEVEDAGTSNTVAETAIPVSEDDDDVLMGLYRTEGREHLDMLAADLAKAIETGMISDAQYRALHTLSGISESASVPGIRSLASALYDYFGVLHQDGRSAVPEAFAVLDDCVREMDVQLQRLPDRNYDVAVAAGLLDRIAALPAASMPVEEEQEQLHDETGPLAEQEVEAMVAGDEVSGPPAPDLPAGDVTNEEPVAGAGESVDRVAAAGQDHGVVMATEEAADNSITGPVQDEEDIYSGMDQELYDIFVEEASEIIDSSESVLRNWSESPDDRELMVDFQRLLHTLKGGARMVDITAIGDLSHVLESLLTQVADGALPASGDLFFLLQESHDRLAEMLEKVKSRLAVEPAAGLASRLDAFRNGETAVPAVESEIPEQSGDQQTATAATQADADEPAGGHSHDSERTDDAGSERADQDIQTRTGMDATESDADLTRHAVAVKQQFLDRRKEGRPRSELVRVQSDVLDNMVNNAGEINIYRSRMEQQISNYRFNLNELDQTISRLRDQLRQLEIETETQILFRYEQESENPNLDFDPLELDRYSKLQHLSRSLIESISDLRSLQGLMELTTRDSETLLLQQSRVSIDLQEGLIRTRMIPFASLAPRLRRIVRQSARQLDKKVDLHLRGAEGEMDRAVIERIVAPLEHMLRNAVAHGIESPDSRGKEGKRATGSIMIDFSREGTEIVLRISDDGAGLDIDAIRRRAIERGLMETGMDLPDSDVMQFVLQAGFSTASEVTQIAGRGVGMDVVNSEVKQLGGSLHIDSESGKGSVFTVRMPYTLAINQALLITVGEQVFCVPTGSIEGVVTASPAQLQSCYDEDGQEFGYAGHTYQLMHLGSLLGINRMDLGNARSQVPVLLVRAGDKRIGVQVDSLLGSREVVIKPLGAQLSMIDGITGATILGDGRVVMILDMFAVSRMKMREQAPVRPSNAQEDGRLVVMVVDDSITVRKVTSRLLERSGYRVMTAKDGVDAMGQLQDVVPDMMLLDIEMPRMDGFELATHMRNDERLKHVPIIMITSRTGDKHRERAFEIGVNDYLGKPYQESELLTSINNIIGVNTIALGA